MDDIPALAAGLKKVFTTPSYSERIFELLENKILKGKQRTGRPGMTLWQAFVLGQFRLGLNIDYDRLHTMANDSSTLRQLLGVESTDCNPDKFEFEYQTIVDNTKLLDDATLREINTIIVGMGHDVFKKKRMAALQLKTDSFVVKSNVHFPTDYNLWFFWIKTRTMESKVDLKSRKKWEGPFGRNQFLS